MSEHYESFIDVPREFIRDGMQFINKCQKPDKKEFLKISQAIALGFLTMGTVGFIVKLIHIPINNILVGAA
ncbi:hypothetical protein CDD81_5472 [Ophiocordyceps australis]|uniref:Protein translocase SEC61 complex gamma subunit, archaeal and eukaryotic n=1 Tax=Ophiocordyceps australis TaxID=1399860 RepID=A0A2C5Y2W6_9HYPO|nr:hypothetical protein CDD81_5472 [Ophiocordyceps australis]